MIAVLLAEGFEEIEALTTVDIFRRENLDIRTVGVTGKTVTGAHGIPVVADHTVDELSADTVEMLVLPGGMPGTKNLDHYAGLDSMLSAVLANGGHLGAICAAPSLLGKRGLLNGKKATCYPGFEDQLLGATYIDCDAVTDGNITTGHGMTTSLAFANKLLDVWKNRTSPAPDSDAEDAQELDNSQFFDAVALTIRQGSASTSLLQRKLHIGYGKAAAFIEMMEELGIVGEKNGAKPRKVLISMEEWQKSLAERNG